MAKEKHLAVVEVGAVVELAKGLTSSHLIQPMRMMLILILIFFVKYSWILFLGDEVQQPPIMVPNPQFMYYVHHHFC